MRFVIDSHSAVPVFICQEFGPVLRCAGIYVVVSSFITCIAICYVDWGLWVDVGVQIVVIAWDCSVSVDGTITFVDVHMGLEVNVDLIGVEDIFEFALEYMGLPPAFFFFVIYDFC